MKYLSKRKKKKKINWYYRFLFIFLIIFGLFFISFGPVSRYIYKTDLKSYVTSIFFKPVNYLKNSIFHCDNKKLEKEVIDLKLENSKLKENKSEIENLKRLIKEDLYTDYKKIYSKVLYRDKMYFYNTITIDKGSKSGIKEGSLVVSKDGLVGTVKYVSLNNSKVELITSNTNDNKISVGIKTKDGFKYGTLESYDNPYLKIEMTTSSKDIEEKMLVVTSGLGNLPKGVELGKVEKAERDSYDLTSILYVRPLCDIEDINYVMVLVK